MSAFDAQSGDREWSHVTHDQAIAPGESRIIFMGPRRSGKSSIERVVFHKMSPHETLFLETTQNVDINLVNNDLIRFQTWDFGGDISLYDNVQYGEGSMTPDEIFKRTSTLVYVIDAQEEDYEDALPKLVETISTAHHVNPNIHFEVFLHKVDGDFMSEETKAERQQGIQHYVSGELGETNGDVLVSYYLTSIYDHSALEALSKVVQKLVPQLPTLNNLLDILISSCNIDKSYLVDVVTKLYIATDSNPVDVHTYELCSDLVDVVVDVSYIYGVKVIENKENKNDDNGAIGAPVIRSVPYDSKSTAAIRLNSGMVLYLRYVSPFLALVCVIREEYFTKRSLLDYNIDCFTTSLERVCNENNKRQHARGLTTGAGAAAAGGAGVVSSNSTGAGGAANSGTATGGASDGAAGAGTGIGAGAGAGASGSGSAGIDSNAGGGNVVSVDTDTSIAIGSGASDAAGTSSGAGTRGGSSIRSAE